MVLENKYKVKIKCDNSEKSPGGEDNGEGGGQVVMENKPNVSYKNKCKLKKKDM